ncbi:MAG: hypothetical protein M3463_20700, partial [Verrucomicrobiota bacterium]|nr:hypothetical protein [Verrucomicrobiota bacterium]
ARFPQHHPRSLLPGPRGAQATGNQRVTDLEIAGRNHGSIAELIHQPGDPVRKAIISFIRENSAASRAKGEPPGQAR